jgi:hypothetical protein
LLILGSRCGPRPRCQWLDQSSRPRGTRPPVARHHSTHSTHSTTEPCLSSILHPALPPLAAPRPSSRPARCPAATSNYVAEMFTPAPGRPNSCLCTWHAVCSAHYENLPPDWTYSCTHHNRSEHCCCQYPLPAPGSWRAAPSPRPKLAWSVGAGYPAVPAPASWPCWGWLDTHHRFSACSNSRRTGSCRPAVDRYPAPPTLLLPPLPAPAATTPTPTGPAITSPTHRSAGTGPLAAAHPTPDRLRNNISHSGALRPNLSPAWGDNRLRANCPSVTHPLAPRRVRWEHVAVDQKRSAGGLGPSPGTMCLASCKSTVTRLPTELGR